MIKSLGLVGTFYIFDNQFDKKYSKNCNIVKYYYNLKGMISVWTHFKLQFIPLS